jgi:hypothetical protein
MICLTSLSVVQIRPIQRRMVISEYMQTPNYFGYTRMLLETATCIEATPKKRHFLCYQWEMHSRDKLLGTPT